MVMAIFLLPKPFSAGIMELDREQINYKTTPVQDRIQRLKQKLEEGITKTAEFSRPFF